MDDNWHYLEYTCTERGGGELYIDDQLVGSNLKPCYLQFYKKE
jgi:hypothetical protein